MELFFSFLFVTALLLSIVFFSEQFATSQTFGSHLDPKSEDGEEIERLMRKRKFHTGRGNDILHVDYGERTNVNYVSKFEGVMTSFYYVKLEEKGNRRIPKRSNLHNEIQKYYEESS